MVAFLFYIPEMFGFSQFTEELLKDLQIKHCNAATSASNNNNTNFF